MVCEPQAGDPEPVDVPGVEHAAAAEVAERKSTGAPGTV